MSDVLFNNSKVQFIRYNDSIPTVTITEGQVSTHGKDSYQRLR